MGMICGIFARTAGAVAGLDAMLAALPGRDDDLSAAWAEGPVALGWRGDAAVARLLGRAGGAERSAAPKVPTPPIERHAGLVGTASARVDDRAALGAALGLPRAESGRLSDTAMVLRACRRWGEDAPQRLLGDYAFASWDPERRALLLARDHIGARPLYYRLTADRLVFASDVKAVLAAPGVPQAFDEAATATWLERGGWPFGERTFFEGVRRLAPGHLLTVASGTVRVVRWWRPEEAPPVPAGDDRAVGEALRKLLANAVEDRLRGAGEVGVHLSGGLDSSSVAVLAARMRRRDGRPAPTAFSWQPKPAPPGAVPVAAEHRFIKAVAQQEGLSVAYCPPAPGDVLASLRRDVTRDADHHENEWPVQARAAARGVQVMLSGWGGDEGVSFNGRGYYPDLLRRLRVGALWRELRGRGGKPAAAFVLDAALPLIWPAAARLAQRSRLRLRRGEWPFSRHRSYLHPSVARRVRLLPWPPEPRPGDVRRGQLHVLEYGGLATRIDAWAASGARLGIEYAYPLLDRRLLEFALGLAPEQFRRGAESRCAMRRALEGVLPEPVRLQRSKEDPVRYAAYKASFAAALGEVRTILADGRAAPSRAAYLDMAGLLRHLDADPDDYRGRPRPGALTRALQFLDF